MPNIQNIPEYKVSDFNNKFREIVENNFGYIRIRGEISELKTASKGQIYLTLKDNNSILSGVIWESKINFLNIKPEIGMEIVASGRVTTWSRYKTTYQIDIDNVEIAGEGTLLKIIEDRKKRLLAKGYFDIKYKKKIPFIPKKVGVITSPTGSVIYDIINRLKERFPIKVDIWPVAVQGNKSAEDIINAILGFNSDNYLEKPDVLIIARGGGSLEDLMSFNDEGLALATFESNIPIVSAIGHETDTSIIDYVSDLRVPTPTAAAEKIVPVRNELIDQINVSLNRLLRSVELIIKQNQNHLSNISKLIKTPQAIFTSNMNHITNLGKELDKIFDDVKEKKLYELKNLAIKLQSPDSQIKLKKEESKNLSKDLDQIISKKLINKIYSFNNLKGLLNSNSIEKNLKKGFAIIKKSKRIIKKTSQIKDNEKITIKLIDNQVDVKVKII